MDNEIIKICCHLDLIAPAHVQVIDFDKDGDLDLFIVSAFNTWEKAEVQSFFWLENEGKMQFWKHTHL
jgi:hypothetical protein